MNFLIRRAISGSEKFSSSSSWIADKEANENPEEDSDEPSEVLLIKKFTQAYNNVRNKKRGGPVTCYECGELYHIRANCPKLKGKSNHKEEKPAWRKPQGNKSKFDASKLRKAVHRVLAAYGEQSMSDVDSESEEDKEEELPQDKKGKSMSDFGSFFDPRVFGRFLVLI